MLYFCHLILDLSSKRSFNFSHPFLLFSLTPLNLMGWGDIGRNNALLAYSVLAYSLKLIPLHSRRLELFSYTPTPRLLWSFYFSFPLGFQLRACLVMLLTGFRSVWPIHLHFLFLHLYRLVLVPSFIRDHPWPPDLYCASEALVNE